MSEISKQEALEYAGMDDCPASYDGYPGHVICLRGDGPDECPGDKDTCPLKAKEEGDDVSKAG